MPQKFTRQPEAKGTTLAHFIALDICEGCVNSSLVGDTATKLTHSEMYSQFLALSEWLNAFTPPERAMQHFATSLRLVDP